MERPGTRCHVGCHVLSGATHTASPPVTSTPSPSASGEEEEEEEEGEEGFGDASVTLTQIQNAGSGAPVSLSVWRVGAVGDLRPFGCPCA